MPSHGHVAQAISVAKGPCLLMVIAALLLGAVVGSIRDLGPGPLVTHGRLGFPNFIFPGAILDIYIQVYIITRISPKHRLSVP